jgi:hypothetical protein
MVSRELLPSNINIPLALAGLPKRGVLVPAYWEMVDSQD